MSFSAFAMTTVVVIALACFQGSAAIVLPESGWVFFTIIKVVFGVRGTIVEKVLKDHFTISERFISCSLVKCGSDLDGDFGDIR